MQLEIQKYLRSGKSIQDLIWEYDLQAFYSDKYPDLVCFDYSIISPKSEKIVEEARGLVLQKQNWDVACISIPAFEYFNEDFEYSNARALEKYDGCLVILFYYENEWITATRFSVDGDCYVASAYTIEKKLKWKELFYQAISDMGFEKDYFLNSLDTNKCYSFELCSNVNKNIVIYDDTFVKLISITNKITYIEENIFNNKLFLNIFSDFLPNSFYINSKKDVNTYLEKNHPGFALEGLVLLDEKFRRIKIRNKNYDAITSTVALSNEEKVEDYIQNLIKAVSPPIESLKYCYTYPLDPSLRILCNSDTIPLPSGAYLISFNNADCTTCDNTILYSWCRDNGDGTQNCVGGSISAPYDPGYLNGTYTIDQYAGPFFNLNCDGTCLTYEPPGGGGGGGALSVMSTKTKGCTSNWIPKKQSNDQPVASSIIEISQWFRNQFMKYKSGDTESKEKMLSVWDLAFYQMNEGKGITSILINSSLEEQMNAIQKYNDMSRRNLL
jgi:hypothetical protein